MPSKERIAYLFQRFFDKTVTIEERKELMYYINKSNNHGSLKALIDLTWKKELPNYEQPAGQADEIFGYIIGQQEQEAAPVVSMPVKKWLLIAGSAAAVLVLSAGIYWWAQPGRANVQQPLAVIEYHAGVGELKTVLLPDGSEVKINANSSLQLDKGFNQQNRQVVLTGEAFFKVTHNAAKPFIIHTNKMDVKVLGTTFNVKAYPDDSTYETSLIRGSVEVMYTAEKNRKVVLHPNEKVTVINKEPLVIASSQPLPAGRLQPESNRVMVRPITIDEKDSSIVEINWTENKLSFSDNSFEEIARKIERWYGVTVRFDNEKARNYRFTITIQKESLDLVMKALQLSISGDYQYEIDQQHKIVYIR